MSRSVTEGRRRPVFHAGVMSGCVALALGLGLAGEPARADIDWGDSAVFELDVAPECHGPAWSDSWDFWLDAMLVARGWGDSNTFGTGGGPTVDDFRVVGISAEYPGVFAEGIDVINTVTAYVDWDDATPAYVVFDLNGAMTSVPTSGQAAQITYNMGSDLLYSRAGYRNTLTVYAIDGNGRLSQPTKTYFWGLALPEWAFQFETPADLGFRIDPLTGKITFFGESKIIFNPAHPEGKLEATLNIPQGIPEIGGKWGLEIEPLNFEWELAAQPRFGDGAGLTGTFDVAGTWRTKAKCGTKRKGEVSATLGGAGEFYPEFRLTDVSAELAGSLSFLFPRVPLLCQWTGCCHTGRCPYFQASITPEIVGTVGMTEGEPALIAGLKFKNATLDIGVTLAGTVGAGSEGSIYYIAGTIGGKPYIVLQFPGDPANSCLNEYIQEVGFELMAKFVVECAWWKVEEEWVFEIYTCPDDGKRYLLGTPLRDTRRVVLVEREYLGATEGYCVFPPRGEPGRSIPGLPDPILNVGTGPRPSLAATNDDGVLLFVYDDPNKPTGKHQEIYYARWSGSAWTAHAPLTDNLGPDVEPAVALDANAVPVAVWTAGPEPGGSETGPTDVLPGLEMAWSTYDEVSNTWSAPLALTANAHVDVLPWFEWSVTGELRACWVSSPTNAIPAWHDEEIVPSLDVMAADWDGTTFSAPYALATALSAVSQPSVARSATHEFLAYLRDTDGNSGTAEDREVTVRVRELGQPWGTDVDLTSDSVSDSAARVAVDALGVPVVVWTKRMVPVDVGGDEATHVDQLWFAQWNGADWDAPAMAFETDGITEPQLIRSESGRLLLFWVAASQEFSDIYYSVYDADQGAWGLPQQLTTDQDAETMIALSQTGGNILAAYVKRRIDLTDPSGLPQIGLSDLYLMEHAPVRDLSVSDEGLSFEPAAFEPGDTIDVCASVYLGGDFTVTDVIVEFYDGDPNDGGVLIGMSTIPAMLPGESVATCVSWLVPSDGESHVVHVRLDPADVIPEIDEANNAAMSRVFQPDLRAGALAALGYPAADTVIVGCEIRNIGSSIAGASTMEIHRDDPNGPVLFSADVVALEPGAGTAAHFMWDVAALPPGTYSLVAVVDSAAAVDESSETNNIVVSEVPVLADLQAEQWSAVVDTTTARLLVRNVGAKPMGETLVRVARGDAVLGEGAVPALLPAESVEVTFPLTAPTHAGAVDVVVNPDSDGSDEVSLLNNAALYIVQSNADFDGDSDVDVDDCVIFALCMAGPDVVTVPPGATAEQFARADQDGDLDVDIVDFALFQTLFGN